MAALLNIDDNSSPATLFLMLLSSISGRNLGDPNKQACFFDLADNSKMQDSNSVFFIFVSFDPLI